MRSCVRCSSLVLAALCDEERTLVGDPRRPESMVKPDNEREWDLWRTRYRTCGQDRNLRFIPLYDVRDERYTVYFPTRPPAGRAGKARSGRRQR